MIRYFLAAVVSISALPLLSQESGTGSYIQVMGTAEMTVKANAMELAIFIISQSEDARTAQQEVLEKSKKVLSYMKDKGYVEQVTSDRVQLDVRNQYNNDNGVVQYHGRQQISFKLTNLSKYEELTLGLIDAGVRQFHTMGFCFDNQEQVEMQLLAKALENARQKAQLLAGESGKKLGEVLVITDESNSQGGPQPYRDGLKALSSSSEAALGETTVQLRQQINVRFKLN